MFSSFSCACVSAHWYTGMHPSLRRVLQIGRKPTGPAQEECEKNYRVVGLRDTYCTFLTTRKH